MRGIGFCLCWLVGGEGERQGEDGKATDER